jgi:3-oxoacyl-ACP reductase-like protein
MLSLIYYSVLGLAAYYVLAASALVPWETPTPLPLSDDQRETLITALRWVLVLGLVQETNAWLNRLAENNWRFTNDKKTWNWTEEVAVVTGGSNGIGAAVVRELVSHGIKVAVLDIEPLSKDFQDGE